MLIGILVLAILMTNYYCKKGETSAAKVNLYLLDAPAYYKAVNVDIQKIMVKCEGSNIEKEVILNYPGVYNLLDYSNGHDTLLGSINLSPSRITQIRIVFGSNNNFVSDSKNATLNLSSDIETGAVIKADQQIESGKSYNLWLDFDVSRSVDSLENGVYYLNPVVRGFSDNITGGIRGMVIPVDVKPFVYAISDSDTLGTITNNDGLFLIRGVPAGKYMIKFVPQKPGILEGILDSIEVKQDSISYIGTIVLN